MFSHLQKNIQILELNKEHILSLWMEYDIVQKKLTQNQMNITFFREKFASKVFDFAMSVVHTKNCVGDCPVIGVMLMLFKKKNIPLSDIFIICVHFKNALLHFAYENKLLNADTLKELSILMDYNFEGVINEYVLLYYKDPNILKIDSSQCNNSKKEQIKKREQLAVTTTPSVPATSAQEYLEEIHLDMEMIEELIELESDTLNALGACEELDETSLEESANLFKKYANVLNSMMEFDELAYTLNLLSDLLNEIIYETIESDTKFMVDIYLKAIISDLRSWREAIFVNKNAEDIHYLDKTLLSSIAQIQMTLMPKVEESEEEIEFF